MAIIRISEARFDEVSAALEAGARQCKRGRDRAVLRELLDGLGRREAPPSTLATEPDPQPVVQPVAAEPAPAPVEVESVAPSNDLDALILKAVLDGSTKTDLVKDIGSLEEFTQAAVRSRFDELVADGVITEGEERGAYVADPAKLEKSSANEAQSG